MSATPWKSPWKLLPDDAAVVWLRPITPQKPLLAIWDNATKSFYLLDGRGIFWWAVDAWQPTDPPIPWEPTGDPVTFVGPPGPPGTAGPPGPTPRFVFIGGPLANTPTPTPGDANEALGPVDGHEGELAIIVSWLASEDRYAGPSDGDIPIGSAWHHPTLFIALTNDMNTGNGTSWVQFAEAIA